MARRTAPLASKTLLEDSEAAVRVLVNHAQTFTHVVTDPGRHDHVAPVTTGNPGLGHTVRWSQHCARSQSCCSLHIRDSLRSEDVHWRSLVCWTGAGEC